MTLNPVEVVRGSSPVILGLPHTGTHVSERVMAKLNARGRILADTDWHIERLYDGLLPGATTVRATFHRYVIDANRGLDDASLYPGQNTTGLVPVTDFDGEPIWAEEPSAADIAERKANFHAPYHAALTAEIERVKAEHGVVILYDCHSIRSVIPFLFEGVLPDFNIGTNDGTTCDPRLEAATFEICAATGRTHVLNGRFKGGWTTRHYGRPRDGVHAIQMELAQSSHLASEAAPFDYDETKAAALRATLGAILQRLAALAPELKA